MKQKKGKKYLQFKKKYIYKEVLCARVSITLFYRLVNKILIRLYMNIFRVWGNRALYYLGNGTFYPLESGPLILWDPDHLSWSGTPSGIRDTVNRTCYPLVPMDHFLWYPYHLSWSGTPFGLRDTGNGTWYSLVSGPLILWYPYHLSWSGTPSGIRDTGNGTCCPLVAGPIILWDRAIWVLRYNQFMNA